MVTRVCGVHLKSRTASAELYSQLGIECITDMVKRSRLRWFLTGRMGREKIVMIGFQCVEKDLVELDLYQECALD